MKSTKWKVISALLALCLLCSVFAFLNKDKLVGAEDETTAEVEETIGGVDAGTTAPETTEPELVPATWVKSDNVETYSYTANETTYSGVKISFAANTVYRVVFDNSIGDGEDFYVGSEIYYDDAAEDYILGNYKFLTSSYSNDNILFDDIYSNAEDYDFCIYDTGDNELVDENGEFLITVYEMQGDIDSFNYTACNSSFGELAGIDGDRLKVDWPAYDFKLVKLELPEGAVYNINHLIEIGDDDSANCGCGSSKNASLVEYDSESNVVYFIFTYTECICNYVRMPSIIDYYDQIEVSCFDLSTVTVSD